MSSPVTEPDHLSQHHQSAYWSLHLPRFVHQSRQQMEQHIANANAAAAARTSAAAAAALQRQRDNYPNLIGADDASSTPSSAGRAASTQPTSADSIPGPSGISPTAPLPNTTTAQQDNSSRTSSTDSVNAALLPRPQSSHPSAPNTTAPQTLLPNNNSNPDPQLPTLHRHPPPKPLCRLYITHKTFLKKGVRISHYPLSTNQQCPLCHDRFSIQNAAFPTEQPKRVMLTAKRCACHYHRACLESISGQACPCCGMKWWKRGVGRWFADVTRPDNVVAAGRPGYAFVAPRPAELA
ncbi:hypothetical protein T440DRAFT_476717 [Plenodomus tracheiphilus IPT5]|uniref:RING-type domain-containing protein n=1 Tax=Plenodomus tracheiphilus IPT5 TaxID=1408161 RepID=A0A6A7BD72_9PLEO|nr:hypothetical protein T440DRAFT_476717 [Plenodomus tracheiphilus IPT5]